VLLIPCPNNGHRDWKYKSCSINHEQLTSSGKIVGLEHHAI
jgi:hypothetical protein